MHWNFSFLLAAVLCAALPEEAAEGLLLGNPLLIRGERYLFCFAWK